jgi:hypothetical protein
MRYSDRFSRYFSSAISQLIRAAIYCQTVALRTTRRAHGGVLEHALVTDAGSIGQQ